MKHSATALTLIFSVWAASTAYAQDYDLVINGGRVMDPETLFDKVTNVGIKDGRILAITDDALSGTETIDATGLVVAPGFIDTHFHAVDVFASKMALRDGVTTGMDLEAGALNVGEWYDKRAADGWQLNYGTTVGHTFVRMLMHDPEVDMSGPIDYSGSTEFFAAAASDGVQGWAVSRSDIDQMNTITQTVDENLRQGALGVGLSLAYMAKGATSYEIFESQRAAANYGRLASVHTRYHLNAQTPTEAPIAFDEIYTNATLLDAPLLVAHNNDYGWWEIEEKLKLARARGQNMWSEYYPYTAGSTQISAEFLRPDQWEDVNGYEYEDTIYDPLEDAYLSKSEYEAARDANPGQPVVVFLPARKAWLPYWLTVPRMAVASDAMIGIGVDGQLLPYEADYSEYAGHPRTAGTRGKVLRLGREQGVPLMFTLSQLSYWTALPLGETGLEAMQDRGRVQVGKIADLTLFDPETVTDNATYKAGENGLPTTGMPYVIVNGTIVVKDSEVLPVKPGQPIRYPVEAEGRFEPASIESFIADTTILSGTYPPLDDSGAKQMHDAD